MLERRKAVLFPSSLPTYPPLSAVNGWNPGSTLVIRNDFQERSHTSWVLFSTSFVLQVKVSCFLHFLHVQQLFVLFVYTLQSCRRWWQLHYCFYCRSPQQPLFLTWTPIVPNASLIQDRLLCHESHCLLRPCQRGGSLWQWGHIGQRSHQPSSHEIQESIKQGITQLSFSL